MTLRFKDELKMPQASGMPASLCGKIDRLETTMRALRDKAPPALSELLDKSVWETASFKLSHASGHREANFCTATGLRSHRSEAEERSSYVRFATSVRESIKSAGRVGDTLLTALRANSVHADLREHISYPQPLGSAERSLYCHPSRIRSRLDELVLKISESELPPSFLAIAAQAVFLNIHPFSDGNGRSGRLLFNALNNAGTGESELYLPLATIIRASNGGYEIRIRDVEVNGNWGALVDYFQRPSLSRVELGIRAGASERVTRIGIDDLLVSVRGGRVRLLSQRLGKWITLRMSNAHAFDRDASLPIYRFLCHVSNQEPTVKLPNFRDEYPEALFAPGLTCKGIYISRPTWLIPEVEVSLLKSMRADVRGEHWLRLAERMRLPTVVAIVEDDRVIPFNWRIPWMRTEMVRMITTRGSALLTEPTPASKVPALSSSSGLHNHEIQLTIRVPQRPSGNDARGVKIDDVMRDLGDGWLYLKLHTSTRNMESILAGIYRCAEALCLNATISGYFYVHYRDESGTHLRLRFSLGLHVSAGMAIDPVLAALRTIEHDGVRPEITICKYIREVERYGGETYLAKCEQVWMMESRVFARNHDTDESEATYWCCVATAVDSLMGGARASDAYRKIRVREESRCRLP